jgi:hypothetical protein
MSMELSQETRKDLWQKVIHKLKVWIFDETFAPIARLESIRILFAYATHHCFKLYQMDIKSAFLNGPIK